MGRPAEKVGIYDHTEEMRPGEKKAKYTISRNNEIVAMRLVV